MVRKIVKHGVLCVYDKDDWLHNPNGPAALWPSGRREYYKHGRRHREDGPAVIESSGTEHYYLDGRLVDEAALDVYKLKNWLKAG